MSDNELSRLEIVRKAIEKRLSQAIDGSPHKWFEERGPVCTLIYTVDDATGIIGAGRFCPSETTWDYMKLMNQTLQDRLVKELRLQQISTLEEVNAFLPTFIQGFNKRFAVVPKDPNNAHRPLLPEHNLEHIFVTKERRTLSKNLTFQYKNTIYQVVTNREVYALRNATIIVYETQEGSVKVSYKDKKLMLKTHDLQERQREEVDSKHLNALLEELIKPCTAKNKPSKRHPYKRQAGRGPLLGVI